MSSDPSYASDNAFTTFDNTSYLDAIAIVGCVMAAMIALLILRYFLNILIDVIILGDCDSARRSIGNLFRRLCPWWHRRTTPDRMRAQQAHDDEATDTARIEITDAFRNYTLEQRKAIISSILAGKVMQ